MDQALVQVYTGPGKGKTTAATGLIVRALGQGYKVLLVRFLKPNSPQSAEINILQKLSGIDIVTSGLGGVSVRKQPEELAKNVQTIFEQIKPMVLSGYYDLVVLDEFNAVLHKEYLSINEGLQLLDRRPVGTELVLTGRNAPKAVLERADLVTRMEADLHPFLKGIQARPGIEF